MHQSFFLPKRYVPHKAPLLGYASAGVAVDAAPHVVRRRLPIPPHLRRFGMFVMQVSGNSMTLPDGFGLVDGSYVLVDGHDLITDRGHVFAFQMEDSSLVVKRLQLVQGRMSLCSDNPEYPPVRVYSGIRNRGRVYAVSSDGYAWQALKYWKGYI